MLCSRALHGAGSAFGSLQVHDSEAENAAVSSSHTTLVNLFLCQTFQLTARIVDTACRRVLLDASPQLSAGLDASRLRLARRREHSLTGDLFRAGTPDTRSTHRNTFIHLTNPECGEAHHSLWGQDDKDWESSRPFPTSHEACGIMDKGNLPHLGISSIPLPFNSRIAAEKTDEACQLCNIACVHTPLLLSSAARSHHHLPLLRTWLSNWTRSLRMAFTPCPTMPTAALCCEQTDGPRCPFH